jgi:hypothetical protein
MPYKNSISDCKLNDQFIRQLYTFVFRKRYLNSVIFHTNFNPSLKFKNTGFEIQGLLLFVGISEDGWLAPYNDDGMIMQVF